MKLTAFIILFGAALFVKAQDAKADFKKINEVYNTTPAFTMDIKYELFLDGKTAPHETETGKYVKQNKKYYTRQAQNEVIISDTYLFMIDKGARILAADHKVDDRKLVNPLTESLDSLFIMYSKIDQINTGSPSIKAYRFYIKEGPYSSCDVYFNTKTNFVTEIKNVFREKIADENDKLRSAVLRTTFTNIKQDISSVQYVFDESRYIKKVKQKYVLSDNYKAYKFINHLN
jgi:hypothetical protein